MENNSDEDMEKNIETKELMLSLMEMYDLTTILYLVNDIYADKAKLERIFKETEYNACIQKIELLENDDDIQQAFYRRFEDIDYNEDSIESRAVTMHSIGAALCISNSIIKIQEKIGKPFEDIIADTMNNMKKEDLMQIIEWVRYSSIASFPKVHDVVLSRIDEMTEGEFIMYLTSCKASKIGNNSEIKSKVYNKIRSFGNTYISYYINVFSDDDEFILELLKKASKDEKVNAIISTGVSRKHSKELNDTIKEMISNLPYEEFVRFLACETDMACKDIDITIRERLEELKNDDLKFLLYVYEEMNPSQRIWMIEDLMVKKGLTEEKNGTNLCAYEVDEVKRYYLKYRTYDFADRFFVDSLPYPSGFDVAKIKIDDEDISKQNMVETFQDNEAIIGNYIGFINYIKSLSKAKDEELYKTILKANKRYKLDENANNDLKEYINFTALYLLNRILNFEDKKLLSKLMVLSEYDAPLTIAIKTRMEEKEFSIPDSLVIKENDSKKSDLEETNDIKGFDDSKELE